MPEEPFDSDAEFSADPVLIVIKQAAPAAGTDGAPAAVGADAAPSAGGDQQDLDSLLQSAGATMQPLFDVGTGGTTSAGAPSAPGAPESSADTLQLANFYVVDGPADSLESLANQLRQLATVAAAYVKPAAVPPFWGNAATAPAAAPPAATPDFTSRQGYLEAAPGGMDARYAWTVKGGTGTGVQIVDVEGAWLMNHEDLLQNNGGVGGGTPTTDISWRNHGTSVLGEISADDNSFGVIGICPDATVRAVSIFGSTSSAAIQRAADLLNEGDVLLIELHRAGPKTNFQNNNNQTGYIAVEWWPDDYTAIRYAINKGVIVVEAAGNGGENLDDPLYDTPGPGFGTGWSNPFRRGARDSGAILVGAGAPPPGTHGKDWGPDRSRLWFSNYGSPVDVQGWGLEVTTTGGSHANPGDLQGGPNEAQWYTDTFGGTSGASPMIVGVLGCVQGVRRGAGQNPITASDARNLLRTTGSPQQDGNNGPATQNIGKRPDLKALIAAIQSTIFNANDGVTSGDGTTAVA